MKKVIKLIGFVLGVTVFTTGASCGDPLTVSIRTPSVSLVEGTSLVLEAIPQNGAGAYKYSWTVPSTGFATLSSANAKAATLTSEPGKLTRCYDRVSVALKVTDESGNTADALPVEIIVVRQKCPLTVKDLGFKDNEVTSLSLRGRDLWVGTSSGVVKLDTSMPQTGLFGAPITYANSNFGHTKPAKLSAASYANAILAPEGSENIWVAPTNLKDNQGRGAQFFKPNIDPNDPFSSVGWIRYSSDTESLGDPFNYKVFLADTFGAFSKGDLVRVMASNNNHTLFGTYNGLAIVGPNHELVGAVRNQGQYISSIAKDSKGNIWVGMENGTFGSGDGIYVYSGTDYTQLAHYSGSVWVDLDDEGNVGVGALAEDSAGNMWIGLNGSIGGLVRFTPGANGDYNSGNFVGPLRPSRASETIVKALVKDKVGTLWVATTKGLGKIPDGFDPKTGVLAAPDTSITNITSLAYDSTDNVLWIGQTTGLLRYQL